MSKACPKTQRSTLLLIAHRRSKTNAIQTAARAFGSACAQSISSDEGLSRDDALALADRTDTAELAQQAAKLRDLGFGNIVTYSRKVFIPLTQLCRDVCHYCTFAQTPKHIPQVYMPIEEVIATCKAGAELGCQEALFTLGEKPELRYRAARESLAEMGFATTIDYVIEAARRVLTETGLLPHINAGNLTRDEMLALRDVSASMGIMLESASSRLCERHAALWLARQRSCDSACHARPCWRAAHTFYLGHFDRHRRDATRAYRITASPPGTPINDSATYKKSSCRIFRAKPHTKMAHAPKPDLDELLWTLAVARLIFGSDMSIQAPPNLSPGVLEQLVAAGINDWGGVSPLTPIMSIRRAPWPHLAQLARETASAGKFLDQRLTIYPRYLTSAQNWLSSKVRPSALRQSDAEGYAKRDDWVAGVSEHAPFFESRKLSAASPDIAAIITRCLENPHYGVEITSLLKPRR